MQHLVISGLSRQHEPTVLDVPHFPGILILSLRCAFTMVRSREQVVRSRPGDDRSRLVVRVCNCVCAGWARGGWVSWHPKCGRILSPLADIQHVTTVMNSLPALGLHRSNGGTCTSSASSARNSVMFYRGRICSLHCWSILCVRND